MIDVPAEAVEEVEPVIGHKEQPRFWTLTSEGAGFILRRDQGLVSGNGRGRLVSFRQFADHQLAFSSLAGGGVHFPLLRR